MRINEGFELFEIDGIPYILPFGQNIADLKKGFRLNESGLILWNGISEGLNRIELIERLSLIYEADSSEKKILETDVDEFLEKLRLYGVISGNSYAQNEKKRLFTIGNVRVNINASGELISDCFKEFECSEYDSYNLSISIKAGYPSVTENGQILIRNRELYVIKKADGYIFTFPEAKQIIEAHLSMDGKDACIYVHSPYTEQLKEDLYHAIRLIYLYRAQLENMFVVHSASILYKNKIWLFSAPSGVGKSTHVGLWHDLYQTPIINGDLNMLAIENNKPVVHGIPWCGTSGIYDNETYALGGIVFIKRGDTNEYLELSSDEKALCLMQRMISPAWTKEMLEKNLEFAKDIAELVPICRLKCTKDFLAAEIMKKWIDDNEKV